MALIVQKFGGTSVADTTKIIAAARKAIREVRSGNQVVMVVSAMGKQTDHLIALAKEISPRPNNREMDMLMSTGEQVTIALMAIALEFLGHKAVSFTGAQIGIRTDATYSKARIRSISTDRMRRALDEGKIVIADRFAWSTFAYQGYARGLGADMVQQLTEVTCGGCIPELTVVLDLTVEQSRARTAKRGEAPDRLEQEKADFFERVRQGYLAAAREFPDCVSVIDVDRPFEEVSADIYKLVKSRL